MELGKKARAVAPVLASSTAEQKNNALLAIKKALIAKRDVFEKANKEDCDEAAKAVAAGTLSEQLYKRLDCTGKKFDTILAGIDDVLSLEDPIGVCTHAKELSDGLNLYRVTCPIGVILIIFESRPDACVQIMALALKSGNSAILKGGKEARRSLQAIQSIIFEGLKGVEGIPEGSYQLCDSRDDVDALLKLDQYVDLVVPRGSNELVTHIKNNTTIPVLGHAAGICLTYVDKDADLDMAVKIVEDAKLNYPAACNALEQLLVHQQVAEKFLHALGEQLKSKNVKYKADVQSLAFLPKDAATAATPEDFRTEFLSLTMGVKVISDVDAAIAHINDHGSHHTDIIVTKNPDTADKFMKGVDSAGVYCNCSSRFADGFRYGFGAEVGISTNKIHARGPVGLEGLTSYRYRLYGKGHCVAQFGGSGPDQRKFTHKDIPVANIKRIDDVAARQKTSF